MSKSTPHLNETIPISAPEDWNESQLLHLLRRSLVGVTRSDLAAFEGLSRAEAIKKVLEIVPFPSDPPVNDYQSAYEDPNVAKGSPWVEAVTGWALEPPVDEVETGRLVSLIGWLLNQTINQQPSIHYKMLLFWHNHLATESFAVFASKSSYQYFKTLWQYSLGNFKALIKAITLDPCMLNYLNGTFNKKEQPDENYARELQELFCIGKGPEANYTESDIREAARVLTGWALDWESFYTIGPAKAQFNRWNHDEGDKQFSAFYNNQTISGRAGEDGATELDELIDMVVEHPECARFICRKLYRFFVHSEIDGVVEVELIEPLANLFRDNNYEIAPVLEALLSADQFYDKAGAVIKSPMDALIGFWRTVGIQYPSQGDPIDQKYHTHTALYWKMIEMGFNFTNPPNVSGWPAYYQIPSYDKLWITTRSLISRISITDGLLFWGFWTPGEIVRWDFVAYTETLDNPTDPNDLIEEVLKMHVAVPVDQSVKLRLKSILLTGQQTDDYWTNAWTDYLNDPGNEMVKGVVEQRLRFLYLNIFQLPEYQLL